MTIILHNLDRPIWGNHKLALGGLSGSASALSAQECENRHQRKHRAEANDFEFGLHNTIDTAIAILCIGNFAATASRLSSRNFLLKGIPT